MKQVPVSLHIDAEAVTGFLLLLRIVTSEVGDSSACDVEARSRREVVPLTLLDLTGALALLSEQ